MRRADDDVLMNAEDVTLSMAPHCQVGKMDHRGRKKTRIVLLVWEEENFDYKLYGSQNAKCVCGIVNSKIETQKLLTEHVLKFVTLII